MATRKKTTRKSSPPDREGKKAAPNRSTLSSAPTKSRKSAKPTEANGLIVPETSTEESEKLKSKSQDRRSAKKKRTLAEKADKFSCYQKSVQCPEHDVSFFEQIYGDFHSSKPRSLREDFCGTFAVCCEWVKRDSQRKAVGVDLCGETLQWGKDHNLKELKPKQRARVQLLQQDVRQINQPAVDILAAQNFSFWIFQTRLEVIAYLKAARENLKSGGLMVLDMMGGSDCFREGTKDKKVIGKGKKKFNYYWQQRRFNPANSNARFAISFRFRDGSKLENAFEYDWRFWTIPEVREMLIEAGFRTTRVYFENEEDDTVWECREQAPSHNVWLAYIVAMR